MAINAGSGYYISFDYGTIAKCPHCNAVDIIRTVKHQITCGKRACRRKQNRKRPRAK